MRPSSFGARRGAPDSPEPARVGASEELGLKERRVIVAGASRGIGRAVAERFTLLGAHVASIQRGRGVGLSLSADLSSPHEAEEATTSAIQSLGGLDVCVYAAATTCRMSAFEMPIADWERVLAVNLTGAFVVTRTAALQFRAQGYGGAIVHLASELSFFGGMGVCAYSASKGGVAQVTKSQSNEWAGEGIRVNAVAPGWIETEFTRALREDHVRHREISARIPAGRWGQPDEIASAVCWLASPAAHYVTGTVLVVDGGYQAR